MVFVSLTLFISPVYATSQRAYQDYLYQFDTYRTIKLDFQTARDEYLHFQTLSSQTKAFEKTKQFLVQRDNLVKSYFLLLSERLDESIGVSADNKGKYQQFLASDSAFLTAHAQQVPQTLSLDAAIAQSTPFEAQYRILQRDIRRVLLTLALGQIKTLNDTVVSLIGDAQIIIDTNTNAFPSQKQSTITQWMQQIQKKEDLFQQKYTTLTGAAATLDGFDPDDLNRNYVVILKGITDARQYLVDCSLYLGELKNSLKFIE
jgi:hypothetical protein